MTLRSLLPRLGLVAAATALGVSAAIHPAAADPTDTTEPPPTEPVPTESVPQTPPSEPPAESSAPSSETPAEPVTDVTPKRLVDLDVLVDFDKESYRTGENMSIRFEIVNLLAEPALDVSATVRYWEPNAIQTDYESWGALQNGGVDIPAGGSHVVTVTGRVGVPGATTGELAGYLYDATGSSVTEFRHTVTITPTFGRAAGIVYTDENNNARYDAGEGVPDVVVTAQNQMYYDDVTYETTTGPDGSFTFPTLPTVRMQLSTTAPDGWLIGYQFVTIDESNSNDNLRVRGVRPLTDLAASLAFDKDTYREGELAKVKIRLTNSGDSDLIGIVANCNRVGNSDNLNGRGEGWGALAGAGVTVPANRTLNLTVTEAVPRAALVSGTVHVNCDFSYSYVEDDRNPHDSDEARVPGGFGTVDGIVGHFANGYDQPPVGVGDARLVLATDAHCPLVAETRSDADGKFSFPKLPTGEYDLYLFPPDGWRALHENPSPVYVRADETATLVPEVAEGDATPPTLPTQPPDCQPPAGAQPRGRTAPAASTSADGLADTGANVLGLLVVGFGTLATGAAGVVAARRSNDTKVTVGSR